MLGSDHLLLVHRAGYVERYRRIDLADVEAWALEPTEVWHRTSVVWGVAFLAVAAFAVLAGGGFRIFWAVLAGAALSGLAIHRLRGPSARVQLRTPLGWIEVPAWRRLATAEQALALLEERVSALQGELGAAEARQRLGEVSSLLRVPSVESDLPAEPVVVLPVPEPAAFDARAGMPTAVGVPRARWHGRLALAISGGLVLSLLQSSIEGASLDFIAALYVLLELGLAIAALVSQADSSLPSGLRRWTVVALVTLSATFVAMIYVSMFATLFAAIESGSKPPEFGAPTQLAGSVRETLTLASSFVSAGLLAWWVAVRPARGGSAPEAS